MKLLGVNDKTINGLPTVSLPLDGTELLPIYQGGATEKITTLQLGVSQIKGLTADEAARTSVTPSKVTALDITTGTGAFKFEYRIVYRSAALTTGIKLDVNHSGTVDPFVWNTYYIDTAATASTGAPDQDAVASTAQVTGGYGRRAKGTAGAITTLSVDTANSDMLIVIEGLFYCTVSGDLQLYVGTEVAASGITVRRGTSAELIKAA